MGAGRNTTLPSDKEIELAECLKILARWSFDLTRCKMKELVEEYISALGCENTTSFHDWFTNFFISLLPDGCWGLWPSEN